MEPAFDKSRYTLAIFLSLFVLLIWAFFFSEPVQDQRDIAQNQTQEETSPLQKSENSVSRSGNNEPISSPATPLSPVSPVSQDQEDGQEVEVIPEEVITLKNERVEIKLSSKNAVITTSILKVDEGHYSKNLESGTDPTLATGRIFFSHPENITQIKDDYFRIVEKNSSRVIFQTTYQFSEVERPITLTKTYQLKDYGVSLSVQFENLAPFQDINYYLINGSSFNGFKTSENYFDIKQLSYNIDDELETVISPGILDIFSDPVMSQEINQKIDWISIDDRFYSRILKIEEDSKSSLNSAFFFKEGVDLNKIDFEVDPKVDLASVSGNWNYQVGGYHMESSQANQFEFVYLPKKRDLLNDLYDSEKSYYFNLFHQFNFMRILSSMMYWILVQINSVFQSYGLSILLMTILLKLAIFPLTQSSMKSMQKMQLLAPKIEAIKKNNKKNPQKLNQDLMGLYKKEGVNPLGGCLPMLIPLPIFISLYSLFQNMVELQGESFLWIHDLSLPDVIFTLDSSLPFVGSDFHLLPFFMVITAFVQSMVSPQATGTISKEARQQMVMMKYFMPIFFFFISWNMPSALILYWSMQNIFSIAQTLIVKKNLSPKT